MLGGISQPRVSQLVRDGTLIADRDADGLLQYDRASVERLASVRAQRRALDNGDAAEKQALHAEARDRAARERKRLHALEEARIKQRDEWKERATIALERIAECLQRNQR